MTTASNLDRRITVERYFVDEIDEYGNPVAHWVDVATVWAKRTDLSDSEKLAGYGVVNTLFSRFLVRDTPSSRNFLADDRIQHDGRTWEIKGVKEAQEGRLRYLEISAATEL